MDGSSGAQEMHNGLEFSPAEQRENTPPTSISSTQNIPNDSIILHNDDAFKANNEVESNHEGPPLKRRRTAETLTPQRSSSRAASPPWRKVAVEGPTSFIADGKRKSARTNVLPVELQPPGEKRKTRAAVGQPSGTIKAKYGGASSVKPLPLASSQRQNEAKTKTARSLSNAGMQTSKPSSTKVKASGSKGGAANPTSTPTRQSHRRKSRTFKAQSPSLPQKPLSSPLQKRGPGRPRKTSIIKREDDTRLTNGWHHTSEDEEKPVISSGDEAVDTSDSDDDLASTTPEPIVDPNFKPQRLRFKVKPPAPPPVQHPSHAPQPKMYPNLREWLEADDPFEGSNITRLTDEEAMREAMLRNRIEAAAQPGGLLDPNASSAMMPDVEEEPPTQRTHRDFLSAHVAYFAKLLRQEHRKHGENARRLANSALLKWKANQPKSQEELRVEREERERLVIEATHRQCVHDLVAKWDLLRGEMHVWRFERWKEEQEALGKETLNRVLEESSKLLDSRLVDASDHGSSSDGSEIEDERNGYDFQNDQDADSERMSTDDEGEEDVEDQTGFNPDDMLTAEELRLKYSNARMQDPDRPPDLLANGSPVPGPVQTETPISGEDDEAKHTINKGLDFEDEMVKAKIAVAQKDANGEGFDLSEDESTDMDSEESDESDKEEKQERSEEEEDDDEPMGLALLLGGSLRKNVTANNADAIEQADEMDLEYCPPDPPAEVIKPDADEYEEEIEEVSLIPDAAQVQTPSSNLDVPVLKTETDLFQSPSSKSSNLKISSTVEADLDQPTPMQSPPTNESRPVTRGSMPATPISVDLERKQIVTQEVPHLLRGTLREYQREGFNWLADRYKYNANGILADEMGLGKTIQTITLLAYLAVKHQIWGPHLVVVPTSVILNWEMEFKKFLPGFKILSYYGSQDERKQKRKGWLDDDRWNVVITSYQLVVSDQNSFKRRGWHYLILDEAHNIKNFRSQRWQTLLTFRSHARLLLTGTPLQNNLEELWSLLFFLVGPDKAEEFLGRSEFSQLFKKPADQILENDQRHLDAESREQVQKLHQVLRPRLLRRLKADVEKQMPGKYEHVVYCKLSKRQRYLYDGFLSRSQTRETLARGNYLSIINCLMQLRKVCNHPDLFETRPIVTSFAMPRSVVADFEIKDLLVRRRLLQEDDSERVSLDVVDLLPGGNEQLSALDTIQKFRLGALYRLRELAHYQEYSGKMNPNMLLDGSTAKSSLEYMENRSRSSVLKDLAHASYLTSLRSQRRPLYSYSLADRIRFHPNCLPEPPAPIRRLDLAEWYSQISPIMQDMVKTLPQRSNLMQDYVKKFSCVTPAVVAPDLYETNLSTPVVEVLRQTQKSYPQDAFHESRMRLSIAFPDKRLLQYDCGKLQRLDALLRTLQSGGHRALIFTQMTKVLDILEQFLNIHGHRYLRLDGSTKLEQRQILTERFNSDTSILAFVLSSRSGGLGINLTGADTVIFYDLDWNPAMDKQCQDRCHRIGQTRDVHIYRFVSEYTIEANILRKSNQKRLLDDVIIQGGDFTTDYFNKPTARDTFEDEALRDVDAEASAAFDRVLGIGNTSGEDPTKIFEQAEDREDVAAARIAEKEVVNADEADFADRDSRAGERHSSQQAASAPNRRFSRGASSGLSKPQASLSDGHPLMSRSKADSLSTITMVNAASSAGLLDATGMPPGYERGDVAPRTDMSSDIFLEKQPVGVDRHMVEFLEWELNGVPFVPPQSMLGAKKGKKGHKGKKVEEVTIRKKKA